MTALEEQATALRTRLVEELSAGGAIRDPAWRRAFLSVPRHRFVPAFLRRTPDGYETVEATTDPQQWLDGVYRNDSLTVAHVAGVATSSSTEPALMATMLDSLELDEGQRVLEIGTGTGYHAALLCARLGDDHVTSIEIDQTLAEAARETLAQLGHHPTITVGEGLAGCPDHAPYARIVATCATDHLPPAWRAQTHPGGLILANLGYGLAKLRRHEDGSASGRFLATTAAFIAARPAGTPPDLPVHETITLATSHDGDQCAVTAPTGWDDPEFWFVARLLLPTVSLVTLQLDEGVDSESGGRQRHVLVDPVTRSWARAELTGDTGTVHQGGERRLWDELARVADRWGDTGRPRHDQLGLTVDPDDRHLLWNGDSTRPFATWYPRHPR